MEELSDKDWWLPDLECDSQTLVKHDKEIDNNNTEKKEEDTLEGLIEEATTYSFPWPEPPPHISDSLRKCIHQWTRMRERYPEPRFETPEHHSLECEALLQCQWEEEEPVSESFAARFSPYFDPGEKKMPPSLENAVYSMKIPLQEWEEERAVTQLLVQSVQQELTPSTTPSLKKKHMVQKKPVAQKTHAKQKTQAHTRTHRSMF